PRILQTDPRKYLMDKNITRNFCQESENMNNSRKLALLQDEQWLQDYEDQIIDRWNRYHVAMEEIRSTHGSLQKFSRAHEFFGIHFDNERKGWWYREWAPAAYQLFFMGDFNDWNRRSHPMTRDQWGNWEIFLPCQDYRDRFLQESKVKVHEINALRNHDRIPVYNRKTILYETTRDFSGQLWFESD